MPFVSGVTGSPWSAIAAVLLLVIAALGPGRAVLRRTCPPIAGDQDRRGDAILLSFVLGLNLLAWLGLLAGLLKALPGGLAVLPLVLGSAGTLLSVAASRSRNPEQQASVALPAAVPARNARELRQGSLLRRRLAGARHPWLLLAMPLLLTLGPALCLPSGWDELVYQQVVPQRWLRDGWPHVYQDLPYSGFPSLNAILFWLMAPLDVLIAPRLLIWLCWLVAGIALLRVLRRCVTAGPAMMLTLSFLCSPAALLISANCYAEALLLLNLAALLLLAVRPASAEFSGRPFAGVIPGILCGGAAAVKLTGLILPAVPLLWYGWRLRTNQPALRRATLQEAAVMLLTAAFFVLPFYVRPWLETGNPCYPYWMAWFTSSTATLEMSQFHHAIGDAAFGVRSLATFLTAPLLLAYQDTLYDGVFGWQLPVLTALGAVAVFSRRRTTGVPGTAWMMLAVGLLYVFWYSTAQQARFAAPTVLLLTVVAANGASALPRLLQHAVVAGLAIATLVSLPVRTAGYYVGSWETLCGQWSWPEYVNDGTGGYYLPLIQAIQEHTPPDARLLLLFEHRSLYVPRFSVIGTPFFQESGFTPPEDFSRGQAVLQLLQEQQLTHLVMARQPIGPDLAPDWWTRLGPLFQGIDDGLQRQWLTVIWESPEYLLLQVTAETTLPSTTRP